jgi:hypothetical protein
MEIYRTTQRATFLMVDVPVLWKSSLDFAPDPSQVGVPVETNNMGGELLACAGTRLPWTV